MRCHLKGLTLFPKEFNLHAQSCVHMESQVVAACIQLLSHVAALSCTQILWAWSSSLSSFHSVYVGNLPSQDWIIHSCVRDCTTVGRSLRKPFRSRTVAMHMTQACLEKWSLRSGEHTYDLALHGGQRGGARGPEGSQPAPPSHKAAHDSNPAPQDLMYYITTHYRPVVFVISRPTIIKTPSLRCLH